METFPTHKILNLAVPFTLANYLFHRPFSHSDTVHGWEVTLSTVGRLCPGCLTPKAHTVTVGRLCPGCWTPKTHTVHGWEVHTVHGWEAHKELTKKSAKKKGRSEENAEVGSL